MLELACCARRHEELVVASRRALPTFPLSAPPDWMPAAAEPDIRLIHIYEESVHSRGVCAMMGISLGGWHISEYPHSIYIEKAKPNVKFGLENFD